MNNKTCMKCKKESNINNFHRDKSRKDGYNVYCKKCEQEKQKTYREKNRDKLKTYYQKNKHKIIRTDDNREKEALYRRKNRLKLRKYREKYRKENPWVFTRDKANQRCNNPKNQDYDRYGGRGIECNITSAELKELWFRDKAYNMKRPSIDRIDNNGNYEYSNCRYIEQAENTRRAVKKPKK